MLDLNSKVKIITTHPIAKKYKLVFFDGNPSYIINVKEVYGRNTEGSSICINNINYKIIKRQYVSNEILELHLENEEEV
ncbi:hypothetical protein UA38_00810 [Photobacterium kishitanii]|uniref:Uncharacterized protein n=1 Tax=Photobacterium kishitanii TaxID=318456 RepID=A0AAX0YZ03_9GAMM|nr:hypothetical protein UA38_00810 [Photobacterium kishitanii]KJG63031.1 hypothetical protein UA42_01180 [Photobacterium kishitanii]KJG67957.1 hypothetical protein UA40_01660 [Photobacterium kishitanii]KJG71205.1 hypothetical protein UA41_00820 [Photobacterium kishitanii]PSX20488.1 hypothetical protein C0W70_06360 [Photobacterium kishitanii]